MISREVIGRIWWCTVLVHDGALTVKCGGNLLTNPELCYPAPKQLILQDPALLFDGE